MSTKQDVIFYVSACARVRQRERDLLEAEEERELLEAPIATRARFIATNFDPFLPLSPGDLYQFEVSPGLSGDQVTFYLEDTEYDEGVQDWVRNIVFRLTCPLDWFWRPEAEVRDLAQQMRKQEDARAAQKSLQEYEEQERRERERQQEELLTRTREMVERDRQYRQRLLHLLEEQP